MSQLQTDAVSIHPSNQSRPEGAFHCVRFDKRSPTAAFNDHRQRNPERGPRAPLIEGRSNDVLASKKTKKERRKRDQKSIRNRNQKRASFFESRCSVLPHARPTLHTRYDDVRLFGLRGSKLPTPDTGHWSVRLVRLVGF